MNDCDSLKCNFQDKPISTILGNYTNMKNCSNKR